MLLSTKLLKTICPSLKQYDLNELEKGLNAVGIEVEEVLYQKPNAQLQLCFIKNITDHPTKPNLHVCQVLLQNGTELQIVCGAQNIQKNKCAVLAPVGSIINSMQIQEKDLYGIKSQGMLCAYSELSPNFSQYLSRQENSEIILLAASHFENKDVNINDLLGLDDIILDLFLPTNRNELNGVYLLANELKAFFNQEFEFEDIVLDDLNNIGLNIKSSDVLGFNLFSFELIRNYEFTSWHWKKFLINSGIHITNNLADLANFVTLLTANPIHLYDANKVDLQTFEVLNLTEDATFIGLDNKTYALKPGDLVARDKNKILALLGIMGGLDSKVDAYTKNVLCEIGNFDPKLIKQTATRLKINSVAANLFSKSLSPTLAGLARITIATLAFKSYVKQIDNLFNYKNYEPVTVETSVEQLNEFLGTKLSYDDLKEILARTGFKFENNHVYIPSYRNDVHDFQDVAEEILKSININDFKPAVMQYEPIIVAANQLSVYDQCQIVRDTLLAKQFNELKTYNLTSIEDWKLFNWFKITKMIEIKNPISKEHAVLRVNMLKQMLDVLTYNINRKQPLQNVFEIQKIQVDLKNSFDCLNVIMTKDVYINLLDKSSVKVDLLFLKGLVSLLFKQLKINSNDFSFADNIKLQETYEKNTIEIKRSNFVIGYLAQLKKSVLKPYGLDDNDVYCLVLNLSALYNNNFIVNNQIQPISSFNPVYRDLSFYVQEHFQLQDLIADLLEIDAIKDVQLSDVFNKDKQVSYTLTLKIQDLTHTLNNEEISKIYNKAVSVLKNHSLELKNG